MTTLTVLVVEDDRDEAERFRKLLETPNPKWNAIKVVPRFRVVVVHSAAVAIRELKQAARRLQPFAVILLDLGLPSGKAGDTDVLAEFGFQVGNYAMAHPAACGPVVVASQFERRPLVREALGSFAADYVFKNSKDVDDEEIYWSVVTACRNGLKAWQAGWVAVLRQHLADRQLALVYARVADRMARVVSEHTATALYRVADLARRLEERYHLDTERDRDDPVCRAVRAVEDAVVATARKTAETRGALTAEARGARDTTPEEAVPVGVDLAREVDRAVRGCAPGLAFARVRWVAEDADPVAPVPTFPLDLEFVLHELVVNAVEAQVEAGGDGPELRTRVAPAADGRVEVRVSDRAAPLPPGVADDLNEGREFGPSEGRGFGLSLARRVAHGIGGRLEVAPTADGNAVTLSLPVAARG